MSARNSLQGAVRNGAVVIGWLGLMAGGYVALMRYEGTSGKIAGAPLQNEQFRRGDHCSLVIALHPKCPCSRATVGELEKIYSHAPGKFSITVLAYKPKAEPDSWIRSDSLATIEKLHPAIVIDQDGAQADKLGLATSGQILLYSPSGKLLYNGGITKARGHSGDNLGEQALLDLISGSPTSLSSAPVFGCPIFNRAP